MKRNRLFSAMRREADCVRRIRRAGLIIATSPSSQLSLETGHSLGSRLGREADATLVQATTTREENLVQLVQFGTIGTSNHHQGGDLSALTLWYIWVQLVFLAHSQATIKWRIRSNRENIKLFGSRRKF